MVHPHDVRQTDRLNQKSAAHSEELDKGKVFLGLFLKPKRRIFAYIFTLLPHRADA